MLEKKQWGWKKSHKEDNGKQRRIIHVEEKKWETVWSSWGGRVKGFLKSGGKESKDPLHFFHFFLLLSFWENKYYSLLNVYHLHFICFLKNLWNEEKKMESIHSQRGTCKERDKIEISKKKMLRVEKIKREFVKIMGLLLSIIYGSNTNEPNIQCEPNIKRT